MHIWAANMAVAGSEGESDGAEELDKLIGDKGAPQEPKEQSVVDDAKSIEIDGNEYVAVNIYDNNYYACEEEEEGAHVYSV
ncbi:hypothetical protein C0993_002108 [Termitomyces sp. T159_Od127]|nr:hypothetical protein C0993_002108 [Termitomyces sp. T159_Od127]